MTRLAEEPFVAPVPDTVMARAGTENFPVAIRLLGARTRARLLAVYGFARLADELGDTIEGDRLAALDWLEAELDRAFAGRAAHPLLIALEPVLRECPSLSRGPFVRLLEANRLDQRLASYETWEQLRGYCHLSADPVGEMVLAVFDASTPRRIERADAICTALQLVEHCQDVAEDFAAGRVYLPREDLERFGCGVEELGAAHAGAALRELLAFEVERARGLLAEGAPLLGELRGRARLAVAGFLAGGRSALDGIERADYDVLAGAPVAARGRLVWHLVAALAGRGR